MIDVLQGAPETLTHREKLLLVVLAEDANDGTRITWNSVERPEVLRGAKLSRSQLYAVIKALIAKGALTKLSAGQKNGSAKYKIPKFPEAAQCPGIPDTDPPPQSPSSRDTDDSQCPETPDTDANTQCPENADTEPSQCQEIRDVSVPESGTPTPLFPSFTTPSDSKQEGAPPGALDYGIPTEARPLVDAITSSGVIVRWPFKGNDWFPVLALIKKSGVPAMVEHALKTAARKHIDSARYFMPGWGELAPLPEPRPDGPNLRPVPTSALPQLSTADQRVAQGQALAAMFREEERRALEAGQEPA